jgi:hypothetical protein
MGGEYIYIDNGANVLGVAHLDSWYENSKKFKVDKSGDLMLVTSPQLDDRLGVHIILDVLPKMGIKTDILLTTGEEDGMSSGMGFTTEKQYNWIFSFDRRGSDVVRYQYENKTVDNFLESLGLDVNSGSYSCIAEMGHLECQGINMGAGYHLEHSKKCFVIVEEALLQIKRFQVFFDVFKNVYLPHDYVPYEWSWNNRYYQYGTMDTQDWGDRSWEEDIYGTDVSCHVCKEKYDYCGACGRGYNDDIHEADPIQLMTDEPCQICGVFFSKDDLDHNGLCVDCSDWMKEDELAYWEQKFDKEH